MTITAATTDANAHTAASAPSDARASGWRRWLPKPVAGALPLAPPHRRIYILPSRFGLIYGLALCVLLLGALNYNNNPAILLAMLLGAAALCSSVMTVRHLSRLRIVGFQADDVIAGEAQTCRLRLQLRDGQAPGLVWLKHGGLLMPGSPDAQGVIEFVWPWPSQRRGRRALGTIQLSADYPLGLFRAWCDLAPDVSAIVFPLPETPTPAWPEQHASGGGNAQRRHDQDDWFQLREFQRGDSLREIAWKVSARHDRWLVAESRAQVTASSLRFQLDQVNQLEREHGISRLTAWVLAADAQQRPYVLDLGDHATISSYGSEHRRRALTLLAELP